MTVSRTVRDGLPGRGRCSRAESERHMVRVKIEVSDSTTRLLVVVLAGSIEQAVDYVKDQYAGWQVRVLFPLDSEDFFVRDAPFGMCLVESERRWSG